MSKRDNSRSLTNEQFRGVWPEWMPERHRNLSCPVEDRANPRRPRRDIPWNEDRRSKSFDTFEVTSFASACRSRNARRRTISNGFSFPRSRCLRERERGGEEEGKEETRACGESRGLTLRKAVASCADCYVSHSRIVSGVPQMRTDACVSH